MIAAVLTVAGLLVYVFVLFLLHDRDQDKHDMWYPTALVLTEVVVAGITLLLLSNLDLLRSSVLDDGGLFLLGYFSFFALCFSAAAFCCHLPRVYKRLKGNK